jgi:hypothetical protein
MKPTTRPSNHNIKMIMAIIQSKLSKLTSFFKITNTPIFTDMVDYTSINDCTDNSERSGDLIFNSRVGRMLVNGIVPL